MKTAGNWLRAAAAAAALLMVAAPVRGQQDPRIGLRAGIENAGVAIDNMELVANVGKPAAFISPQPEIAILYANTDMAFRGNTLFMGNFYGVQAFDISDPRAPRAISSLVCPGGQGDVSIHGNLLFMSVEMPNGRTDCGTNGALTPEPSPDRFVGIRIFDVSNLTSPRQVAAVQTCRGSHTHTLVTDPRDAAHVYIYVAGTTPPRPTSELAGCSGAPPAEDPNSSLFRIEVIRVPVAAPQQARIVNAPQIFADAEGNPAGLFAGGQHPSGDQPTAATDQCHDITAYAEIGLAAGACAGNGLLLDIRDPANPRRITEVSDSNFAYWHSATFNNDGSKVLFTDEWGGGTVPRCRATDRKEWGANAIFELNDGELEFKTYYKLAPPQTETENCVAHNGSLVPVPGRDIMVQAWYQGGISVLDFTDANNPFEIAYFDRGPMHETELVLGGVWSSYWYNGFIYGSEIGRGLDVLALTPSEHLTQNELDAARTVRFDVLNPQSQQRLVWPASFVVARAYVDQLRRSNAVPAARLNAVSSELQRIEGLNASQRRTPLTQLATSVGQLTAAAPADERRLELLTQVLQELAR